MSFYSRINSPDEFRKALLTTAKTVILTQTDYEELKSIKQKKSELIKAMEKNMDSIGELGYELEKLLTNTNIKKKLDAKAPNSYNYYEEEDKTEIKPTPTPKPKASPKPKSKEIPQERTFKQDNNELNELDRLEHTLRKIEERIANSKED